MKRKILKSVLAIFTAMAAMSSEAQMRESDLTNCESSSLNTKSIRLTRMTFTPGQRPTRPSQDEMELIRACTDAGILQRPPRPPRGGPDGNFRGAPPQEHELPEGFDSGGGASTGR